MIDSFECEVPRFTRDDTLCFLNTRCDSSLHLREIIFIDLEPDKLFHAAPLRRDGRVSDPEKRIEHRLHAGSAVQLDAPFRELNGKRGGMRPFFCAALNCFVRNKPGVAATA